MAGDSKASKLVERMRDKQSGRSQASRQGSCQGSAGEGRGTGSGRRAGSSTPAPPAPRKLRRKGPLFRLPHGSEFSPATTARARSGRVCSRCRGWPPYEVPGQEPARGDSAAWTALVAGARTAPTGRGQPRRVKPSPSVCAV
jgi:hypothetical protein